MQAHGHDLEGTNSSRLLSLKCLKNVEMALVSPMPELKYMINIQTKRRETGQAAEMCLGAEYIMGGCAKAAQPTDTKQK